ncbi:protein of unknown function [Taphrina deformans PYCC 5710]|uniref:SprT-like domain-containing protein n=1 Tax=Taphrina deformans (strain PYCC 5710 / ATCC 11124 / CBS 356.35 / IMI 108563 / JCM 9778 / NBRC 8474) TaxID=1097556 RepID=R4XGP6_TAPDE|nr:protein of unknown function [Taphrina deformans PYCC 5710]|eukprot:CCG85067.2 protein of unknown function [Taphrina deformans PYCC 5710]
MTRSYSSSSDEEDIFFPDLKELLHSLPSKSAATPHIGIRPLRSAEVDSKKNCTLAQPDWVVYDSEEDSFFAATSTIDAEVNVREERSSNGSSEANTGAPYSEIRKSQTVIEVSPREEPVDGKDQCGFGISLQMVEINSTPPSTPRTDPTKLGKSRRTSVTEAPSSVYYSCASDIEEPESSDNDHDNSCPAVPDHKTRPRFRRRIICDSDSESESTSGSVPPSEEAILSYSPPRSARPQVVKLLDSPRIPATPSSRTTKHRIPRSPHRESNIKFWDEEESNAWVELHKPAATPGRTPLKQSFSSGMLNSNDFRAMRTPKTPKKSVAEINQTKEAKKFLATREELARRFVDEFSEQVCPELASKLSGPIELVWSKTLASTAGRATFSKSKTSARIELSTKVIDCLARLRSTLAHEMCHILVWVIDGQFSNPHGKEFKAFGRRVERLLGIEVDTTHNYTINYKYQWRCTGSDCVRVYGRHSKSLDPSKVVCGTCHSTLVQILPKPRVNATPARLTDGAAAAATGSPAKGDGLGRYQAYLRANIDRIRGANPGLKYAELIKIVAAEYALDKVKSVGNKEPMQELEILVSGIAL